MKTILALLATAVAALAVIQNQLIIIQPNGALSYAVWKRHPGTTNYLFLGTFTGNSYSLPGSHPDGTSFYVTSRHPLPGGQCCVESDLAYVLTPPNGNTTNLLRLVQPLAIQSSQGDGVWTTVAVYTGTPAQLQLRNREMIRAAKTNLPPAPQ